MTDYFHASPVYYSDQELRDWLKALPQDSDVITLPGIPFSQPEIQRELLRREYIRDLLGE